MEAKLFGILVAYFGLGAILLAVVTRGKDSAVRRRHWVKYFVYLLLVNALFLTMVFAPSWFWTWALLIVGAGFCELLHSTWTTREYAVGAVSLLVFAALSCAFLGFSRLCANYLLYALFTTTVFDAFSQMTGQLLGRRKLVPNISPEKTVEGLFGGLLATLMTSVFIRDLLGATVVYAVFLGLATASCALVGDLSASFCKRRFGIKDFSQAIPGHGGFLDRFDSLVATGSFLYVLSPIIP